MRFSRRITKAVPRLLLTLLLVVFSAHHAAPDAPIWHGSGQHNASHARHDRDSSELAFTAIRADHNSHCELCFGSAFSPPVTLSGVPRVALSDPRAAGYAISLGYATDWRLPEAHAPPIA